MATKPAQRAAADKWDAANMAYQTVKVKRALLDDFKAACAARGDKVNTVLREAMERYVAGGGQGVDVPMDDIIAVCAILDSLDLGDSRGERLIKATRDKMARLRDCAIERAGKQAE